MLTEVVDLLLEVMDVFQIVFHGIFPQNPILQIPRFHGSFMDLSRENDTKFEVPASTLRPLEVEDVLREVVGTNPRQNG